MDFIHCFEMHCHFDLSSSLFLLEFDQTRNDLVLFISLTFVLWIFMLGCIVLGIFNLNFSNCTITKYYFREEFAKQVQIENILSWHLQSITISHFPSNNLDYDRFLPWLVQSMFAREVQWGE